MRRDGFKIEAFVLAGADAALAQFDDHASREHVAEFLALVRILHLRFAARGHFHQNRLHAVFLRRGHQPADVPLQTFYVFLHADVVVPEHHPLVARAGEKRAQVAAERGQYVLQRRDRRAGQVALHQRDKALGQLAPVGQLLLRKPALQAQPLDLLSDLLHAAFASPEFRITKPQRG